MGACFPSVMGNSNILLKNLHHTSPISGRPPLINTNEVLLGLLLNNLSTTVLPTHANFHLNFFLMLLIVANQKFTSHNGQNTH